MHNPETLSPETEAAVFNMVETEIETRSETIADARHAVSEIKDRIADENPALGTEQVATIAGKEIVAVAEASIEDKMAPEFQKLALNLALEEGAELYYGNQTTGENPVTTLLLHGYESQLTDGIDQLVTLNPASQEARDVAAADAALIDSTLSRIGVGPESTIDSHVEASANYAGNWTECQTDRMKSDDFKNRFATFTEYGADGLTDAAPTSFFAKRDVLRGDYLARKDELDGLVEDTTSRIEYVDASAYGKSRTSLGSVFESGGEKKVVLFKDAESDGAPLTDKGKDIITAHEMYHRVVSPAGLNVAQIREGFSVEALDGFVETNGKRTNEKYALSPHELTARMAQVKNYFGMKSGELFTKSHLDYARAHYVTDTGLDNNMTAFFKMANDAAFVDLMNTIPV